MFTDITILPKDINNSWEADSLSSVHDIILSFVVPVISHTII